MALITGPSLAYMRVVFPERIARAADGPVEVPKDVMRLLPVPPVMMDGDGDGYGDGDGDGDGAVHCVKY